MVLKRFPTALAFSAGVSLAALVCASSAGAQTLSDRLNKQHQKGTDNKAKDRLVVESQELVFDRDKNTVSAVGNAQLYYQGRVLEADKVTYDRTANRVYASGNAKLTEENGQVAYGDRFELTGDFKDGFIDSLRVETVDRTRLSAPRAERTGGETTVFERGTYTACDACKDDPSKPPLWQVRAKRIIHKNEERTIYYEDATLEFWGVPLAYIPYFSAPDSTVKRKSGFLPPHFVISTPLGYGVSTPYFWAIAPNYDLTITPTFLTRQGVLGSAEWRHRLVNGSYNIKLSGIFQQDQLVFSPPPFGAANKEFRGGIESQGRFLINDKWQYGWDVTTATDKWFFQNYKYRTAYDDVFSITGFKEQISTAFLTGKGERSYFDARGYYFRGLSYADWQKQQPVVAPVVDYDRRFVGLPGIGGEFTLNANLTSLTREQTDYQSLVRADGTTPGNYLFPIGNNVAIYNTCAPGFYNKTDCFVRGVAGSYTRLSTEAAWRRTYIDPVGQSWTPFASMRADLAFASLNTTGTFNQYLPNFIDTSGDLLLRVMPVAGVTYRYPFVAETSWGSHVVEPVAQLIARPREGRIGKLPNEDSQGLVFDDTNLFEVNKFNGYDRVEGGSRANVGAQYTFTTASGAYASALFGQSYALGATNSYATPDLAHVGDDSGLQTQTADYVARLQIVPSASYAFLARSRFDNDTFALKRVELQATAALTDKLSASVIYARYAAQPELGYFVRREGLVVGANYYITPNWYVLGSAVFDLSRNATEKFYQVTGGQSSNAFSMGSMQLGGGYRDECTTVSFVYGNSGKMTLSDGTRERVQTFMVRLELRTLGGAKYSYNQTSLATPDGLTQ